MPEIVDIIDDEVMEVEDSESRSDMSVNLGELTLDSTLNSTVSSLNSTRETLLTVMMMTSRLSKSLLRL